MMKDESIQSALAKIMIVGVACAALALIVGMAVYLPGHASRPEGDRVFTGEPSYLTHVGQMLVKSFDFGAAGERRSLVQLGVLLLLLNPVVRVIFALAGFAAQRDWLYVWASVAVSAALAASFFW